MLAALLPCLRWGSTRNPEGQPPRRPAPPRRAPLRSRFMPCVEALEDRTVPSGVYVFQTLNPPDAGTDPYLGDGAFGTNDRGQVVGYTIDNAIHIHGYLFSQGRFAPVAEPNAGTGFGQGTFPTGINDSGQIVGGYVDANYITHGFLFDHGQYITLDPPDAVGFADARGINDRGQIVGGYADADGVGHGFLLSHGQYTTIDVP